MAKLFMGIWELFCITGGVVLSFLILGLLFYLMCAIWVEFSNKFRDICKAESLIFEYRKYRNDFMYWIKMKKDD